VSGPQKKPGISPRTIEIFEIGIRSQISTYPPETYTSNGQPDINSLSDLLEDDSPVKKKDWLVFAKNSSAFGFVDV